MIEAKRHERFFLEDTETTHNRIIRHLEELRKIPNTEELVRKLEDLAPQAAEIHTRLKLIDLPRFPETASKFEIVFYYLSLVESFTKANSITEKKNVLKTILALLGTRQTSFDEKQSYDKHRQEIFEEILLEDTQQNRQLCLQLAWSFPEKVGEVLGIPWSNYDLRELISTRNPEVLEMLADTMIKKYDRVRQAVGKEVKPGIWEINPHYSKQEEWTQVQQMIGQRLGIKEGKEYFFRAVATANNLYSYIILPDFVSAATRAHELEHVTHPNLSVVVELGQGLNEAMTQWRAIRQVWKMDQVMSLRLNLEYLIHHGMKYRKAKLLFASIFAVKIIPEAFKSALNHQKMSLSLPSYERQVTLLMELFRQNPQLSEAINARYENDTPEHAAKFLTELEKTVGLTGMADLLRMDTEQYFDEKQREYLLSPLEVAERLGYFKSKA